MCLIYHLKCEGSVLSFYGDNFSQFIKLTGILPLTPLLAHLHHPAPSSVYPRADKMLHTSIPGAPVSLSVLFARWHLEYMNAVCPEALNETTEMSKSSMPPGTGPTSVSGPPFREQQQMADSSM